MTQSIINNNALGLSILDALFYALTKEHKLRNLILYSGTKPPLRRFDVLRQCVASYARAKSFDMHISDYLHVCASAIEHQSAVDEVDLHQVCLLNLGWPGGQAKK